MTVDKKSRLLDYEAFYQEAPVGFFTSNASHIIISANPFFFDLVQHDSKDIIGKRGLQDFLTIGGKMYFQTHYSPQLQMAEKIKEINLEIVRKDQTRIPILINTIKSLNQEGAVIFHSVVFNIAQRSLFEKELIAERKHAENLSRQLKETNDKISQQASIINQQNTSLDKLNSIKDKFFSIIAHDIRGPLSQLSSFVTLIQEHMPTLSKEDLIEMSNQLKETMVNTVNLTENLFSWAQSQMNDYKVKLSVFPVEEAVQEVINGNLATAQKKAIKLSYTLSGEPMVRADKNQLLFIIRNLIMNAIKFTPSGGFIKIHGHRAEAGKVKIEILDNGVGMKKEYIETLFIDHKRHSKLGTDGEKGNGLGLVLVKEFVAMNEGTIEVFSEEGKGSTFVVTLISGK